MHIGQKIKRLMEDRGILQSHMAKRIGISTTGMANIFLTEHINTKRLIQICEEMNVSILEFFDESEYKVDEKGEGNKVLRERLKDKEELIASQKEIIEMLKSSLSKNNITIKQTGTSD